VQADDGRDEDLAAGLRLLVLMKPRGQKGVRFPSVRAFRGGARRSEEPGIQPANPEHDPEKLPSGDDPMGGHRLSLS
jgi:hypothetical protein